MIFQRLDDEDLAQVSYLVGCPVAGEAIVIDPTRETDRYLQAARAAGLRIVAVTETHIHADFLSGARDLAARTGARLYLSAAGDAAWQYTYAAAAGAVLLRGGETVTIGRLRLTAVHTPGHTPEHLSFLLTDMAVGDHPVGLFTGDFVFVGDVGRPDLLEKAARVAGSARPAARALFQSLQWFRTLPDSLQVWPGHGAGSACGRAIAARPQSTVGHERLTNWALQIADEEAFVAAVLAGLPDPPPYFAVMKRLNREGPPLQNERRPPVRLTPDRVSGLLAQGVFVLDTRPAQVFASGHLPGALNIPLGRSFLSWVGWLVPYDRPLILVGGDRDWLARGVRALAKIGLDHVAGALTGDDLVAWVAAGGQLATVPLLSPAGLAGRLGDVVVVDVREWDEWAAGHLPGARHLPLGTLRERLDEIPADRPVVVYCQSGNRSTTAASLLQAYGRRPVFGLAGGLTAWREAGLPVERDVA